MKNFDETRQPASEEDRTFLIGGERFIRKTGIRPEALTSFDAIGEGMPPGEILRVIDQLVRDMIYPDQHEAWDALRAREDDPVTLADMMAVANWLVEQEANRPTSPPAPSSTSPEPTGTPSTGGSSSPVTPAPTPLVSVPS